MRSKVEHERRMRESWVQNIMRPVTYINLAVLVFCPLVFWLYTKVFGWGLWGAAMANNTTAFLTMVAMIASMVWIQRSYSVENPKRYAWNGFSIRAFEVRFSCACMPMVRNTLRNDGRLTAAERRG
jgi:Na+-driven multidrug efflux pump